CPGVADQTGRICWTSGTLNDLSGVAVHLQAYSTVCWNSSMKPSVSRRWPRWVPMVAVVAAAAAGIGAVPSLRVSVLRAAGWAVVVNEPVAHADVIVISLDSHGAGALDAADLVQRGMATRVAVFSDPPNEEDQEFIRRGLPHEDATVRQLRQLSSLG